jgi:hypothetical protein
VKIAPSLAPLDGPLVRYRPVIPLRVIAPTPASRSVLVGDAFADPGCDVTVVQRGLLRPLGPISFIHQMNHQWKGNVYCVRFALLRLEIFDGATALMWPAPVGFTDAPIPYGCLLGLSGFFEFLDVHFLGSDRTLEIEPNPLFHAAGGKARSSA